MFITLSSVASCQGSKLMKYLKFYLFSRWNSTFEMLKRLLLLIDSVNAILRETSNVELVLNGADVSNMDDLLNILAVFNEATVTMSGSHYTTVAMIVPVIQSLRNALKPEENDTQFKNVRS